MYFMILYFFTFGISDDGTEDAKLCNVQINSLLHYSSSCKINKKLNSKYRL